MTAPECETCARLKREAEWLKRIDYRSWVEAYNAVLEHQLTCHIWHVATAPNSQFSPNAETEQLSQF